MAVIGIYSWSQYTLPGDLSESYLHSATHANDPNSSTYDAGLIPWLKQPFTFNGGDPTQVGITDDDPYFEDSYVETGAAQTLTSDVTIDGVTYLAGSGIQNEFSMVDPYGTEIWVVRIDGVNVGFTYAVGEEPVAGETYAANVGRDGLAKESGDGVSSTVTFSGVICFEHSMQIETSDGPRHAGHIVPGDLVVTRDNGVQPVRWAGHNRIRFSRRGHQDMPIMFSPGSLGTQYPQQDLIVSPQHRMLMRGPEVEDLFGVTEVLAPAKGLLGMKGVRHMRGTKDIVYVHLLLDNHEILTAHGAATESFFPGPHAMNTLAPVHRREIFRLFPDLIRDPLDGYGSTARPALTVHETKTLVQRKKRRATKLVRSRAKMAEMNAFLPAS